MEINQRIKEIIAHYQLEQQDFADKIGVSNSTISVTDNQLKPAGAKVVFNILREFPEVSCEWLIRGKGDMLLKEKYFDFEKQATKEEPTITQSQYLALLKKVEKIQRDIRKLEKDK